MRKKEPKQILNEYSWIYLFFAVLGVVFAILIPFVPAIVDVFKRAVSNSDNIVLTLEVTLIINALMNFLYFFLIKGYTNGKNKGVLLMILLIIGLIGNIVSIFISNNTSTINIVIDAVVLYYLYISKKNGN